MKPATMNAPTDAPSLRGWVRRVTDLAPQTRALVRCCLVAACGLGTAAWADGADAPMTASVHGAEVVDRGGTVWARCVEGMRWNGRTCIGVPLWLSHSEAVAAAASRRQLDGVAWRLPRVRELQALFHRGIDDVRLFPAAPPGWHWTSTTQLDLSSVNPYNYGNIRRGLDRGNVNRISYLHGWAVHAQTGEASPDHLKRSKLLVRLVRDVDADVPDPPAAAPASR